MGVLITKKVQRDRRTSGYVIAYIEPNGLVDKDGRFKVGDELINVNGQSLRGLNMEAARNVLRQLSGHVDIIVARQPQEATKLPNSGKKKWNFSTTQFFPYFAKFRVQVTCEVGFNSYVFSYGC